MSSSIFPCKMTHAMTLYMIRICTRIGVPHDFHVRLSCRDERRTYQAMLGMSELLVKHAARKKRLLAHWVDKNSYKHNYNSVLTFQYCQFLAGVHFLSQVYNINWHNKYLGYKKRANKYSMRVSSFFLVFFLFCFFSRRKFLLLPVLATLKFRGRVRLCNLFSYCDTVYHRILYLMRNPLLSLAA